MKKAIKALFFVIIATVMLFFSMNRESLGAETFTLKAVTAWSKTTLDVKAYTIFVEVLEQMVAKKCPGELKIQYIGGPEAVKTVDQVQALQRGMFDLLYTSGGYYTNVVPEIDSLKLSTFTAVEERSNGAWAYLNDLHKKFDVYYLARGGLDIKFHLYLKKPIKTADLTGLNIRVSPVYIQMVKALGGNPLVIPPTEAYVALERNVADGYCWPAVGIRDYGWEKQTKYIVDPGFYNVPNPVLINLKVWNRLPTHLQTLLNEAGIEAEKRIVAYFQEIAKQERPILIKAGLQVIELPPGEREKFLSVAYEEGWKDVIQKCPSTGPKLRELLTKK